MPTPILSITDLVVRYGAIEALHGISLHVDPSQIVCLIGANGAGKSSLLRAISGLVPVHSGTITYNPTWCGHPARSLAGVSPAPGTENSGTPPTAVPPPSENWKLKIDNSPPLHLHKTPAHHIVAAGLSHVPEGRGIFPTMSVRENLDLGAYLRRDAAAIAADRDRVFTLFPRLKERLAQFAGTLSGGEQQMLAIGRALMSRPKMLLLDEPSLGLAPILVEQIFTVIKTIHQQGTTVLLVEQNAHMALQIAHYAYVLETGKIALEGPAAEIRASDQVRKAYLGEDQPLDIATKTPPTK